VTDATSVDRAKLDLLEQRMWSEIWSATPAGAAAAHGLELRRHGPVQATAIGDLPGTGWLNLVLGAAAPGAVEGGHLEAATAWVDSLGVAYYVPVTPGLDATDEAEAWLRANGFEHGYGWMKFIRDTSPPEFAEPADVEVAELADGEGEDFARIVAQGFDLPEWAAALFVDLPALPSWRCYLASVDGRPAGTAAMLVEGGIAELGLAATLASARGRGCQNALLRRRILDAAAAGCHTLLVETGERVPDRPSPSYRNILRAGFEEAYLRPNWQRARS
jgi:GNAT superfamily N-acetyltransferase